MGHACRKTKILATLGPTSDSPQLLEQLIEAGADGFRLNFSHGTQDEHAEVIERMKSITSQPVKYLLNTHHHTDHAGGNETFIKTTEIIAKRLHKTDAVATTFLPAFNVPPPPSQRVIKPPRWLGFMMISVGAVLMLHSLALPKPG